jgi:hypothetical protein
MREVHSRQYKGVFCHLYLSKARILSARYQIKREYSEISVPGLYGNDLE